MLDPHSGKTIGYHLFFEPTGSLKESLSEVIDTLAKEYGGPVFTPHVTLLARIEGEEEEVVQKSRALAAQLTPLTLTLGELEYTDTYFKALYMQIQEASALQQLHVTANEIFNMHDETEYVPHLSLLYGLYEKARKDATIANTAVPIGATFLADRLFLYKTHGETTNWQQLYTFTLRS